MSFKKIISLFAICVITNGVKAQETIRKVGLSATLQGNQYGIAVPIWAGKKYVVEPNIAIKSAQSIGSEFGLGIAQRFYFQNKVLAPYAGINLGAIFTIPSSTVIPKTDNQIDIVAGASLGAEYFLAPQFSMRVEAQANVTKSGEKSNQFGNPGNINFNTGTLISASIYF
jgi:hypothetical protein